MERLIGGVRWRDNARQEPVEVREHYAALVSDVSIIELGKIEIPPYSKWCGVRANQISFSGGRNEEGEFERKKGVPWMEDEHMRYLIGLQKYGKGDNKGSKLNLPKVRERDLISKTSDSDSDRRLGPDQT
ncbi:transcription factor MYBS1-like [Aristolochia californica]|uniref:transcription factor MYBS1-like n=1 Tax=Aristolochia californica TaxID=171875 RepID=UPI0035E147A1